MARTEDLPLFDVAASLTDEQLAAEAAEALAPDEGTPHPDLDAARLWRSKADGLLVRGVKPHSAIKSTLVGRATGTVSTAMSGKWFTRQHGLEYLELYSGPGQLLDAHRRGTTGIAPAVTRGRYILHALRLRRLFP